MLHIALWEPEIPPNTGNIARLCAATGCPLHLIGPLGFRIDDKAVRRAGLDYWNDVELYRHDTIMQMMQSLKRQRSEVVESSLTVQAPTVRLLCFSAHAEQPYTKIAFQPGDCLLFGAETRGLPPEVLERSAEQCHTIPMPAGKVRSLNLATAVGIVVYEGLRQLHGW